MTEEGSKKSVEAHPMNGGHGSFSYAKNSSYQKGAADSAKELLTEGITRNLDTGIIGFPATFRVADLGCSVGPNTFFAVENIIKAVELKYKEQGLSSPEFEVLFNDHTLNDFNTLFGSLPPSRQYYGMGVPGSFYDRLFPNASLHFVFSSYAIQWLSQVPKQIVFDKTSPAWNKGRIHYSKSADDVVEAYEAQYVRDMERFLHARAQEVVCGGLMALLIPGRPNGTPHSQTPPTLDLLGSCLMDMAKKGIINEEKVDSFNIPFYYTSPEELEAVVENNGCFSTERMENLPRVPVQATVSRAQELTSHTRAAIEGLIKDQFGNEISEELFDLYRKKIDESFNFESGYKAISLFVLLKRKVTNSF